MLKNLSAVDGAMERIFGSNAKVILVYVSSILFSFTIFAVSA
jgi:hypothetical protein